MFVAGWSSGLRDKHAHQSSVSDRSCAVCGHDDAQGILLID